MRVDYLLVIGQCLYMPLLALGFVMARMPGIVVITSLIVLPICTMFCLSNIDTFEYPNQITWYIGQFLKRNFNQRLFKLNVVPIVFTAVMCSFLIDFRSFFVTIYLGFLGLSYLLKESPYLPITTETPLRQSQPPHRSETPLRRSQTPRRTPPSSSVKRSRQKGGVTHTSDTADWVPQLVEVLKCSVCHNTLAAEVVICLYGHAICRECKDQGVHCCPLCYHRFVPLLCNTLLKQVIKTIPERYHQH